MTWSATRKERKRSAKIINGMEKKKEKKYMWGVTETNYLD